MPLRLIEVITSEELGEQLKEVVNRLEVIDSWRFLDEVTHRAKISFLVPLENTQMVLDVLQSTFGERENTRILISSVEATLPEASVIKIEKTNQGVSQVLDETKLNSHWPKGVSREELYNDVEENTALNFNFILLVLLSTIVATIGLIKNHTPVLIGAMLIAPLLGPNLALALGTVLADFKLMIRAFLVTVIGIGLAIFSSFLIGLLWRYVLHGATFSLYPAIGLDTVVLALASGAAAVLSLISGLSGILIGVMVATALLPPACLTGLFLSLGSYHYALMAFLLLVVNIVCINLSANIVFFLKGIHPYRWYEQQKAKRAVFVNITFLVVALGFLSCMSFCLIG